MSDDGDAKKIILARRARFLTAALASATIACGKEAGTGGCARPCLEPPAVPEDASAQPQVCLKPSVCLSVPIMVDASAPPVPAVCLSVVAPQDASVPIEKLIEDAKKDAGKK